MTSLLDELREERARMLETARVVLAGKSRSYVKDAEALSRYLLSREGEPYTQMLENLTATQERCNELKRELRRAQGIPEEMVLSASPSLPEEGASLHTGPPEHPDRQPLAEG